MREVPTEGTVECSNRNCRGPRYDVADVPELLAVEDGILWFHCPQCCEEHEADFSAPLDRAEAMRGAFITAFVPEAYQ